MRTCKGCVRDGAIAQLGERCNRTAEVVGSIPTSSTKFFSGLHKIKVEVLTTPGLSAGCSSLCRSWLKPELAEKV